MGITCSSITAFPYFAINTMGTALHCTHAAYLLLPDGIGGSSNMHVCPATNIAPLCTYFPQTLWKQQSSLTYLLRVNPLVVMASLNCNLETGDRSTPPEASRCVNIKQDRST